MLNGLGLTATRRRNIKPGNEYDALFPKPDRTDPYLTRSGSNEQTLHAFIPEVVKRYHADTAQLAVLLKRENLRDTLKAIWDFLYNHVQYKPDSPFEEQIRRPARTWADRRTGVDCDCYTVFISSVLMNLRIPHVLRMTAYDKRRGYQHVYVVVPKSAKANLSKRSDYWVIDPVMDAFDSEKPYLFKQDRVMLDWPKGNGLNGLPVRALNGKLPFANRSRLVYDKVYYSPTLRTWAFRGIDGAYYLKANPQLRYVEPYEHQGLGFIATALTAFNIGKSLVKGAKGVNLKNLFKPKAPNNQSAAPQAQANQQAPNITELITQTNNNAVLSVDKLRGEVKQLVTDSNKAAVVSLDNLNKGLVSKIDNTFNSIQPEIDRLSKSMVSTAELTERLNQELQKAIAVSAGSQKLTQDLNEKLVQEQKQNEVFRNDVRSGLRTGQLISIATIALILLNILRKK